MKSGGRAGRTPWCAGLLALLSESHEFKIGIGDHLRVERLLDRVGPTASLAELRHVLAAILATSAEQQKRFYQIFDDYCASLDAPGLEEDAKGDDDGELGGPGAAGVPRPVTRGRRSSRARLRTLLAVGAGATLLLFVESGPRSSQVAVDLDPTLDSPAPAPPSPLPDTMPEVAPHAELLPRLSLPRPQKWYEPYAPLLPWVLALVPLLAFAGYEWRRRHRERAAILRDRVPSPPYVWPLTATKPPAGLLPTPDVVVVSTRLRRRQRSGEQRFAVRRSVAATVAASGFPTFLYEPVTRPPEYLVLVERESARDHQAIYYQTLVGRLSDEGAYTSVYFYGHDPRVCFPAGAGRGLRLADLAALHPDHRLLIVGSGAGLLDPVRSALAGWADLLDAWRERVVLSTTPRERWGGRERILQRMFAVLPGTLDGFSRVSDALEGVPIAPGQRRTRRAKVSAAPVQAPHSPEALRRHLGDDVFRWLCACAVYPELHWDLTLSYTALPELTGRALAREENLLRLFALPWFRSGLMPIELRYDLLMALEAMDRREKKDTELSVRTALAATLARQSPRTESVAGLIIERERLLQDLYIHREEPRKNRELLKQLREQTPDLDLLQDATVVRLLGKVRTSRLALVLPERVRKVLYRYGLPGFGPSRGVTATAGAAAALLLWTGAPRIEPHTGLQVVPLVETVRLSMGSTFDLTAAVVDTSGRPVQGHTVEWRSLNPASVRTTREGRITLVGSIPARVLATAPGSSSAETLIASSRYDGFVFYEAAPRWMLQGTTAGIPWVGPASAASWRARGLCTVSDSLSGRAVSFGPSALNVTGERPGSGTSWEMRGGFVQFTTVHVGSRTSGPIRVLEEPWAISFINNPPADSVVHLSATELARLERKAVVLRSDTALRLRVVVVHRNMSPEVAGRHAVEVYEWFRKAGFAPARIEVGTASEQCSLPARPGSVPPALRVNFTVAGRVPVDSARVYPIIPPRVQLIQGDSLRLAWTLQGSGPIRSSVRWTSADPRIATVTDSGLVRAVNVGSTLLRAEGEAVRPATVPVTVTARPAIGRGYEGTWEDGTGTVVRFTMNLQPGRGNRYSGFVNWTLAQSGGNNDLTGAESGTQNVRGEYDLRNDRLELTGDTPENVSMRVPEEYRLGFSLTRDTITGTVRGVRSAWSGRLRGRRAPPPNRAERLQGILICRYMQADTTPLTLVSRTRSSITIRPQPGIPWAPSSEQTVAGTITSSAPAVVQVVATVLPSTDGTPTATVVIEAIAPGDAVLTYQCGRTVQRIRVRVTEALPPAEEDTTPRPRLEISPVDTVMGLGDQQFRLSARDLPLASDGRCLVSEASDTTLRDLRIPRYVRYIYVFVQSYGPIQEVESERLASAIEKQEFIKCFDSFRELARRRNMRLIITATDAQHRGWYQPEITFRGRHLQVTDYRLPGSSETYPGAEVPVN